VEVKVQAILSVVTPNSRNTVLHNANRKITESYAQSATDTGRRDAAKFTTGA
jgi:hypothetical protein